MFVKLGGPGVPQRRQPAGDPRRGRVFTPAPPSGFWAAGELIKLAQVVE